MLKSLLNRENLNPRFVGTLAYAAALVGISKAVQGTVWAGSQIRVAATRKYPATIR